MGASARALVRTMVGVCVRVCVRTYHALDRVRV